MILSALACGFALTAKPTFTLISTRQVSPFYVIKGPEGQAVSVHQDGFFTSSTESDTPIPSASPELIDLMNQANLGGPSAEVARRREREGYVIWNSATTKIVFDDFMLKELVPNSNKVKAQAKVNSNSHPYLIGNPDWGVFTIDSYNEMPDNDDVFSQLILPGLKASKLPIIETIDWDNNFGWKELGIGQVDDTGGKKAHLEPRTPLVCGDPYTGRVLWKSPVYTFGSKFVGDGKYVAALTLAGTYDLLQPNDGKVVQYNVKELTGLFASFGSLVYISSKVTGQTYCYRISSSS